MKWRPILFVCSGMVAAIAVLVFEYTIALAIQDEVDVNGAATVFLIYLILPTLFVGLCGYALMTAFLVAYSRDQSRSVTHRSVVLIVIHVVAISAISLLAARYYFGANKHDWFVFYVVGCRCTIPFAVAALASCIVGVREMRHLSQKQLQGDQRQSA